MQLNNCASSALLLSFSRFDFAAWREKREREIEREREREREKERERESETYRLSFLRDARVECFQEKKLHLIVWV